MTPGPARRDAWREPEPDTSPVEQAHQHAAATARLEHLLGTARAQLAREVHQRQRLEMELLDLSERERARMGRELHDGLGQALTGIAFLGKALHSRLLEQESPQASSVAQLVQLVNEAVDQVRSLARRLCPAALDAPHLNGALAHLAADALKIHGVAVQLHLPQATSSLQADEANHLLRMAHEAVDNAIKHGQARQIWINLSRKRGSIRLIIIDDGSGMVGREIPLYRGVGLHSMRVRAALMQARLRWRSSAGGTLLMVSQRLYRPTRDH